MHDGMYVAEYGMQRSDEARGGWRQAKTGAMEPLNLLLRLLLLQICTCLFQKQGWAKRR